MNEFGKWIDEHEGFDTLEEIPLAVWDHQQKEIDRLKKDNLELVELGTDQLVTEKIVRLKKEIDKLNIQIDTFLKYREEPYAECVRLQNANCKLDGRIKEIENIMSKFTTTVSDI